MLFAATKFKTTFYIIKVMVININSQCNWSLTGICVPNIKSMLIFFLTYKLKEGTSK